MTPWLTRRGRALVALACVALVAGTGGSAPVLIVLGAVLIAVVAGAYYAAVLRVASIEDGGLALSFTLGDTAARRGLHRGDADVVVDTQLENRSVHGVGPVRVRPVVGDGVRIDEDWQVGGPRRGRAARRAWSLDPLRVGRWRWHGAFVDVDGRLGLTRVSAWLPSPLQLVVLPARSAAASMPWRGPRRRRAAMAGAHVARRPGFGYELRELRDYVPGDSMRRIAWRASAKAGRLIVRELEDELSVTLMLVVDASPSMRGGAEGSRLQSAIDATWDVASGALGQRDRVGVIAFDEAIVADLPPGTGTGQLRRLTGLLVSLGGPIDGASTEGSDDDVVSRVGRYLLVQRRLDFRERDARGRPRQIAGEDLWDRALLEKWIERDAGPRVRSWVDEQLACGVDVRGAALVRQYAGAIGLHLPPRIEARFGAREHALAKALERAAAADRDATLVVVFTDLGGLLDIEPVRAAMALLHARRHRVVFVVPFTPEWVPASDDLDQILHDAFAMAERDERGHVVRTLRELGATVLAMQPDDGPAHLRARIEALRRGL